MSYGAALQQAWLGAPGFATTPGNEAALASLELPKMIQRASEQALWSTYRLGVAGDALASKSTFKTFAVALDNVGQGFTDSLSISETNMKENGRISNGAGFGVYGIAGQLYNIQSTTSIAATPPTATDLWNVTSNCVLQWDLLNTTIDICTLNLAGAGGGVFGSSADTGGSWGAGNGSQVSLNNGAGQVWIYQFLPVLLPAGTTFGIRLLFGSHTAPIDCPAGSGGGTPALALRIVLLGTYRTAVPVG